MLDSLALNFFSFIEGLQHIAYLLAFVSALAETTLGVGLMIPGSSLILVLGMLSAGGDINPWTLVFLSAVGAFLGDNINYYLGERYGSKWTKNGIWIITPEMIEKGKLFFNRHGGKSIFLGRFVPTIKEVIPFIAGTVGMKYSTFIFWNIFGAIGWAMEWVFAGYIFAQSFELAKHWLSRASFAFAILFFTFIFFYFLKILIVKKGTELLQILQKQLLLVYKKILKIGVIKKINKKYPQIGTFIKKRFNTKIFTGLPLTILVGLSLYIVLLIAGSINNLLKTDIIVLADTRVLNFIPLLRSETLTNFFWWITLLGKSKIIILFFINTILLFFIWNKKTFILPIVTTVTGSAAFAYITKNILQRPRPQTALYLEHSYSFPSGHATISVAFYGFLAYFFIRNTKKWNKKVNIFFITATLIALIDLSRIYLGVHYLSDVWSGFLIGALWLVIGITISEYYISKKDVWFKKISSLLFTLTKDKKIKYKYTITVFSLMLCFVGYLYYGHTHQIPKSFETKITIHQKTVSEQDILKNIATHTETLFAKKAQPINIIMLANNDDDIKNFFKEIKWTKPDDLNIYSFLFFLKTKLTNSIYENIPLSPSFYKSEINKFSFEKTHKNKPDIRHFARIWKTDIKTENGLNVYVGTVSADDGMKWLIVHTMNPDVDSARKYLKSGINVKKNKVEEEVFIRPETGKNFSGDTFYTDGKILIIKIK